MSYLTAHVYLAFSLMLLQDNTKKVKPFLLDVPTLNVNAFTLS